MYGLTKFIISTARTIFIYRCIRTRPEATEKLVEKYNTNCQRSKFPLHSQEKYMRTIDKAAFGVRETHINCGVFSATLISSNRNMM